MNTTLCVLENSQFLVGRWHSSLFSTVSVFLVISVGFEKDKHVSLVNHLKPQVSRIYSLIIVLIKIYCVFNKLHGCRDIL